MSHKLISIVIVVYNARKYLASCLQSIFAQTYQNFEIFLVDNASTDDGLSDLPNDPRLKIMRNAENVGFAAAQNQGLHQARGEYLLPLNFDLILDPFSLEKCLELMEKDSRIGTVSPKMLRMTSDLQKTNVFDCAGLLLPARRFPVHRGGGEEDVGQYEDDSIVFGVPGAASFHRREMLDDIAVNGQFFDESFFTWYEDVDLDWRARIRGWLCVYTPAAVVYHVGHPDGNGLDAFHAKYSIRNRWMMILADESRQGLWENLIVLSMEEFGLLRYIFSNRLLPSYIWAIKSLIRSIPLIYAKRKYVQSRATIKALPQYPLHNSH